MGYYHVTLSTPLGDQTFRFQVDVPEHATTGLDAIGFVCTVSDIILSLGFELAGDSMFGTDP